MNGPAELWILRRFSCWQTEEESRGGDRDRGRKDCACGCVHTWDSSILDSACEPERMVFCFNLGRNQTMSAHRNQLLTAPARRGDEPACLIMQPSVFIIRV